MHESDDYLLFAVTAWRQMTWQSFKKTFDDLYLRYRDKDLRNDTAGYRAWRALRALESLAHADAAFSDSGSTVTAAPAVLSRLPISGLPQAVLSGARSANTKEALLDACKGLPCTVSAGPHAYGSGGCFIPSRIVVESETEEALAQCASRLRICLSPVPSAWVLLEYSGTAEEYALSRPTVHAAEIDWPRLDFDTKLIQFRSPASAASGIRLSKYQHPARGTVLQQLWRGDTFQTVDRDWGRYLALKEAGRHVLAYDARHFLFAVPATAPLPRLLARACTLCSGFAPRLARQRGSAVAFPAPCDYELYSGVPPDIAATVAAKAGQHLVPMTLDSFLED